MRNWDERGQVGIVVVFTMIVVAAAVAWAVAAMASSNDPVSTSTLTSAAPAASPASDPLDPENAAAFDGPKHELYDAALARPLSGRAHNITLPIEERTLEVADGKCRRCT